MRIGIIGGGLTGLVAASRLVHDHEVDLLEGMPCLGGCLSSYAVNGYRIERFYHHCFSSDTSLLGLINDLGLADRIEWMRGTTGFYAGGRIHHLTTPLQILTYPELSLTDKVRIGLLTLRARREHPEALDTIPARQYIIDHVGRRGYASFFEPLLKAKFGEESGTVSAAWLFGRIAIRSDRGVVGERLGYMKGGFQYLIDTLERAIVSAGGRVMMETPAHSIVRRNGAWEVNGTRYDTVISTIPPHELTRIGGPEMPPIPYQGAACLTLGTGRDVTAGIYWLNMKDPAPYGAVVSHTNFIPAERYGEHIIYLASYFSGTPPRDLDRRMMSDFCTRFSLKEEEIHWHRMAVDPWAGPVYTTGYRSLIPPYSQQGLYTAGMFSSTNYPERSMEGSVRAGSEVAACVNEQSGSG